MASAVVIAVPTAAPPAATRAVGPNWRAAAKTAAAAVTAPVRASSCAASWRGVRIVRHTLSAPRSAAKAEVAPPPRTGIPRPGMVTQRAASTDGAPAGSTGTGTPPSKCRSRTRGRRALCQAGSARQRRRSSPSRSHRRRPSRGGGERDTRTRPMLVARRVLLRNAPFPSPPRADCRGGIFSHDTSPFPLPPLSPHPPLRCRAAGRAGVEGRAGRPPDASRPPQARPTTPRPEWPPPPTRPSALTWHASPPRPEAAVAAPALARRLRGCQHRPLPRPVPADPASRHNPAAAPGRTARRRPR
eukprot:scaffold5946_cov114-Isochrysis_galbana.AAC.8